MKCFYHNDADGICSGFWVRKLHPNGNYIPINYGIEFPFDLIKEDEVVFIVDYSIEPDEMRRLLSITKNVIWIDHHKTAIEKYKDFEYEVAGIRYDGLAGCILTYAFVMHMGNKNEFNPTMTYDAPFFTALIADWDVWTFNYGDLTRQFHTAFASLNLKPDSPEWFDVALDEPKQNRLLQMGEIMLRFRDGWAKSYMELGYEVDFEGFKCFAVNLGRCNSEYFKSLETEYDILVPFVYNGKGWTVSLYSKTVDVSEIAKKYGGGGHKGASGFQCSELPFK